MNADQTLAGILTLSDLLEYILLEGEDQDRNRN
jgi:hypothetical protein